MGHYSMSSWVRYCVAVYIGLLMSGALARPPWTQVPAPSGIDQPANQQFGPATPPIEPTTSPEAGHEPDATAWARASDTLSV